MVKELAAFFNKILTERKFPVVWKKFKKLSFFLKKEMDIISNISDL